MNKIICVAFCITIAGLVSCKKNNNLFNVNASCLINGNIWESNSGQFATVNYENPSTSKKHQQTEIYLIGRDGSQIMISFLDKKIGPYTVNLSELSTISYFDINANQYQGITGSFTINEFTETDSETKISGNFDFNAQSILDNSVITVINGNFIITKVK